MENSLSYVKYVNMARGLQAKYAQFHHSQSYNIKVEHASVENCPNYKWLSLFDHGDHFSRAGDGLWVLSVVVCIMASYSNPLFRVHNLHNAFMFPFQCVVQKPLLTLTTHIITHKDTHMQ